MRPSPRVPLPMRPRRSLRDPRIAIRRTASRQSPAASSRRVAEANDAGPLLGGFLFIAVSGLLFVALGVFASSVTSNQSVAGIFSCVLLATLILGGNALSDSAWLAEGVLQPAKAAIDYAHVFSHRDDFARGVIDTRHLLFYISGTVLALIFSILSVEAKLLHA